jgi:NADH dehydrogenase [ubiquinone] 1 alpha subcomplex assembly factor 7
VRVCVSSYGVVTVLPLTLPPNETHPISIDRSCRGWCERLVDIRDNHRPHLSRSSDPKPRSDEKSQDPFCFVLSPGPTPASRVYIGKEKLLDPTLSFSSASSSSTSIHPQHQRRQHGTKDTSAPSTPPHLYPPPDHQSSTVEEEKENTTMNVAPQIGDRIEISPMSIALIQDIRNRLAADKGGMPTSIYLYRCIS